MKAVILAAGRGTRMRGLCESTPKPLLPIANRSIVSLLFSRLKGAGIRDVALVVGFEGEKLQALIGDGSRYGVNVAYVWQKEQLGTGHAAMLCEEFVGGEPFVLIFGDILTPAENLAEMVRLFGQDSCDAVLSVFPVEDPSNGAAVTTEGGLVTNVIEKPPPGSIRNAYCNAGVFVWPARMFDLIRDLEKSPRGEYEFSDGITRFIEQGGQLAAFELRGYWENITDPETCIRMNRNVLGELLPPAEPAVDPSAEVGKDAIIENCRIGAGAVIGRGCKLIGCCVGAGARIAGHVSADYAEIQANATVGGGSILGPGASIAEDAVIGSGVRVGPNASVGRECSVGDNATLSSAILLDSSTVGAGAALVNAVVDCGMTVPEGERVTGMPEEVVTLLARRD